VDESRHDALGIQLKIFGVVSLVAEEIDLKPAPREVLLAERDAEIPAANGVPELIERDHAADPVRCHPGRSRLLPAIVILAALFIGPLEFQIDVEMVPVLSIQHHPNLSR
jgi:hypothetical protein